MKYIISISAFLIVAMIGYFMKAYYGAAANLGVCIGLLLSNLYDFIDNKNETKKIVGD